MTTNDRDAVLHSRIGLALSDARKVCVALEKDWTPLAAGGDQEACIRELEAALANAHYWATKLSTWVKS